MGWKDDWARYLSPEGAPHGAEISDGSEKSYDDLSGISGFPADATHANIRQCAAIPATPQKPGRAARRRMRAQRVGQCPAPLPADVRALIAFVAAMQGSTAAEMEATTRLAEQDPKRVRTCLKGLALTILKEMQ